MRHATSGSSRASEARIGADSFVWRVAEPGLAALRDCTTLYHDFAMNLNADVLELALREVGPDRLLYGSDLPVCLMRGVREYDGDAYINYSDGDYTWNTPDRRKPPEIEANYTFYLYEQLRSLKRAAARVGLGQSDVEKVMGLNARTLADEVKGRLARG